MEKGKSKATDPSTSHEQLYKLITQNHEKINECLKILTDLDIKQSSTDISDEKPNKTRAKSATLKKLNLKLASTESIPKPILKQR